MAKKTVIHKENSTKPRQPEKDIDPCGLIQIDKQMIRYLKMVAAQKGIDCQSLIRMWARERLEIEMRKISV